MGLEGIDLGWAALTVIILVCSFVLHEWGHAVMADRLGDDTPRRQGRVTLNPLVHIDPIGSIFLPIVSALGMLGGLFLGWAKPVFTNPANFRRGHFDEALVTLAGPGMNVVLALGATIGAVIAIRVGSSVVDLMHHVLLINVMLTIINLLPIPPFDGSKFLLYFGLMREATYVRVATWGGLIFIGLIYFTAAKDVLERLIILGLVPFALLQEALT